MNTSSKKRPHEGLGISVLPAKHQRIESQLDQAIRGLLLCIDEDIKNDILVEAAMKDMVILSEIMEKFDGLDDDDDDSWIWGSAHCLSGTLDTLIKA